MLGLLDPGDEVVVFEPFYENYGPDAILAGAVPRYVTLHEPDWSIDPDELRAAFGPQTRAHRRQLAAQPDRQGLHARRARAHRRALPGARRHRLHRRHLRAHRVRGRAHPARDAPGDGRPDGQHPLDVEDLLGHRLAVGWVIASPALSVGIRRVHDFLTVGAAAPLQAAAVVALQLPGRLLPRARRPAIASAATRSCRPSRRRLPRPRPGRRLLRHDRHPRRARPTRTTSPSPTGSSRDPGVAAVPGSSFFSRPELGRTKLRFAFPKRLETLEAAAARLARLA